MTEVLMNRFHFTAFRLFKQQLSEMEHFPNVARMMKKDY
jgi:hypothetical protein|nr:hypothetical protein [Mucilaginibacter sp. X4EP1]NYE66070.1 hypothetical protein [Mucilaginibacter sp. E4BP6]